MKILLFIAALALAGCNTPTPSSSRWPAGNGPLLDTNGVPVQIDTNNIAQVSP